VPLFSFLQPHIPMTTKDIEAKLAPIDERIRALTATRESLEAQSVEATRERANLVAEDGPANEIAAHGDSLRTLQDRIAPIADALALLSQQRDDLQGQYSELNQIELRSVAIAEIDGAARAALQARAALADAIELFVVDTLPRLVQENLNAHKAGVQAVQRASNGPLPDAPNFPVAQYVDARVASIVHALTSAAQGFRTNPALR